MASLAMLATSVVALSAISASADQSVRPILDKFPGRTAAQAAADKIVKARKPGAALSTWNGGFKDLNGTNRTFVMVGPDPAKNNSTTTIPFEVVPVVLTYSAFKNQKFDPSKDKYDDGETVVDNFLNSPLVKSNVKWKSGGQKLGKTQYIDAFQRGTFWGYGVSKNSNYHVVLGSPTVMEPLKITVSSGQGVVETNPFGHQQIGTYGFGPMDTQINNYIGSHSSITPDTFVFFITHNVFLTSGGCCIGGYHYSTGSAPTSQSYGYTTFVTETPSFSQDISAATHEIGEWMDDPFPGNNVVGCFDNSWLEVGDPLEHRSDYGDFPLKVGTFTYHPQDLSYIGYFGAPQKWAVKSQLSFHGYGTTICPGQ
ncbi:MAG: hypothetical protein JOY77_04280 [Alphaproteobacteria bacterium]|nr:hypothetical protein [Alphaproteobacteria bacterium]